MTDATSLIPPRPGLSASLVSKKAVNPKENVNMTTLNRLFGDTRHNDKRYDLLNILYFFHFNTCI